MILVKVRVNDYVLYTPDGKNFFVPSGHIGFVSDIEAKKAIRRIKKAFDIISSVKCYENIQLLHI
jgi:hypothetical protein